MRVGPNPGSGPAPASKCPDKKRGWGRQRRHRTYWLTLTLSGARAAKRLPVARGSKLVAFLRGNTGLAHHRNAVKDGAHITFGRIRKVMSRLKISAISYLNTAPLMWDFEHAEAGAEISIFPTPSPRPAPRLLRAGTADIGIIPAAAYTTVPDLVIIPDVAIAARRAVRSILLVSRMPIGRLSKQPL